MDINTYALEVITRSRLADLRANAARQRLRESARAPRRSAWTALRSALAWMGRPHRRRAIQSPRHA